MCDFFLPSRFTPNDSHVSNPGSISLTFVFAQYLVATFEIPGAQYDLPSSEKRSQTKWKY